MLGKPQTLHGERTSATFKAVSLRSTPPHPTSLREATFPRKGGRDGREFLKAVERFLSDAIKRVQHAA
jgi:hypothetical protein